MAIVSFPTKSANPDTITQLELRIAKHREERLDVTLESLYARKVAGAVVEPGPLNLYFRHRPPDALRYSPECEYCQLPRETACGSCIVPKRVRYVS